jgi:hypothetical protein
MNLTGPKPPHVLQKHVKPTLETNEIQPHHRIELCAVLQRIGPRLSRWQN